MGKTGWDLRLALHGHEVIFRGRNAAWIARDAGWEFGLLSGSAFSRAGEISEASAASWSTLVEPSSVSSGPSSGSSVLAFIASRGVVVSLGRIFILDISLLSLLFIIHQRCLIFIQVAIHQLFEDPLDPINNTLDFFAA